MLMGVGHIHLALFALALAFAATRFARARWEVTFFALLTLLAGFFTLAASRPAWDALPLLRFVQFPWRFLILIAFGSSLVGGSAVAAVGGVLPRWERLACLAVLIATIAYYAPNARAKFLLHDLAENTPVAVDLETVRNESAWGENRFPPDWILTPESIVIIGVSSTAQDDYLPIWVEEPPRQTMVKYLEVATGRIYVDNRRESGDRFRYDVQAYEPGTIRLRVFYFPGWVAVVDGHPVATYPEPQSGCILADVPEGAYEVEFHFAGSPLRRRTRALSAFVLILLVLSSIGVGVRQRVRGKKGVV